MPRSGITRGPGAAPDVRKRSFLVLLVPLLLLSLMLSACSLPSCPDDPDGPAIRVSQQAAQRLQARVEQIAAAARPDFVLEMTDEEATSYLSLNLGTTAITEAEVRFQSGLVHLNARVAQILNTEVATTWTAQVVGGQVRVQVTRATIGCLPVPTQLLGPMSDTINQMILESQVSVQVKEIRLEPGKATVTGAKTR